ncbi:DUF3142 domain-containing protein [Pseudomonas aeruginosa]|uniref:DUF3142 domain-containing protein n=1 Tax=Pseudomonas aeruginosa TaxID=287 RepID=UPI00071BEEE8|nr:DUF3142 domain-containing protein [Pseudomonas aeruginosa]EIU1681440.1 DUF3142 domain-containing protein [Pseudomonas aeruginosa]EKV4569792.1 DUF3142 domain-containing protein [Pseudomonas aeruginosa]KSD37637.1 hypothetical protein AO902_09900 [Pseudomonas aeruginosa]MBH8874182.1 DUF3142 domain-containing protein [Pseudomonas aeruginosa]MBI8968315.1 DUF3142 domain-containing protein [Pseudomonas aeruginosa]
MRRWRAWLAGLLLGLPLLPSAEAAVRAEDYDAFWLWSGVAPQPALARAETLYILQGQISQSRRRPGEGVRLIAQGISVPRLARGEVWLVYRAHTLRWTPRIYEAVLNQVQRWKRAGNPVVGIQIDFDARTRYLDEYVDFLRDLRRRLPREYRLSITGLLDWGSNAEPAAINRLKGVVDEVVVQTYQGRHSIPNHAAYLPRVSRLQLPYRIGLVQGGDWRAPDYLEKSPWFKGYVVFLLNPQ